MLFFLLFDIFKIESGDRMNSSKRKMLIISIIVVIIIIAVVLGSTYAYFTARASSNNIVGSTYTSDFGIEVFEVQKSTSLIPLSDDLVTKAVSKASNKCLDNDGQEICSLYKLDVVNNGNAIDLQGFIRTSTSTYTSSNLKYMVYTENGGTYTPVTDALVLSHNSGDTVYFKKNNANYTTSLLDGTTSPQKVTYYIVFWISEINGDQNVDQSKTFDCKIGFESIYGDKLTSTFVVST